STQSNTSVMNHFILVHGLCHGAWCWYKVVAALQAAGHRVTAVDLAASGAHPARIDERLILVGHSHGGLSLALAMERFPGKVAAAVFAAAGMPCVGKHMGVTTEEFMRRTSSEGLMDCKMLPINNNHGAGVADLALAKMLVRPGNLFMEDPVMKDASLLTDTNYGSVKKVYVVAKADGSSTEEMQRWMVLLSPGTEAEEIAGADHAIMSSRPRELCDALVKITNARQV
uniref:AB hydrolase-1 domain-containing protein n=1 Tax=Aegilops tauschii subsp. strangulata TaxID=200361 RepID=A0A453GGZ7_AEGTS